MGIGRSWTLALGLTALGLAAGGCAQDGTFVGPKSNIGSLKASVTQLEHDNEQMRKQLAEMESEKRRLAEKLSQERLANDDLSTRPAPASRPGRSTRKPPFAQIGGIKPAPEPDETDPEKEGSVVPAPTTRI